MEYRVLCYNNNCYDTNSELFQSSTDLVLILLYELTQKYEWLIQYALFNSLFIYVFMGNHHKWYYPPPFQYSADDCSGKSAVELSAMNCCCSKSTVKWICLLIKRNTPLRQT